jgi:hypothetical protein
MLDAYLRYREVQFGQRMDRETVQPVEVKQDIGVRDITDAKPQFAVEATEVEQIKN